MHTASLVDTSIFAPRVHNRGVFQFDFFVRNMIDVFSKFHDAIEEAERLFAALNLE